MGSTSYNELYQQIHLFRQHALGNYRDLLLRVAKNPAMIYWLDQHENHKYAVNENWGRELLELFSNPLGKWGTAGSGPGELNGPCGLAFDRENNLYVVDSLNHRVQTFTKDGTFLRGWGRYGSGEGEFNMPWGITLDSNGAVYVADWKNHRVQQFTPEGTFLRQFGRPAPGAGELRYPPSYPTDVPGGHLWRREGEVGVLNHPADVAVDKDGDVYVTDWANSRVQIYTPEGEFITSLYGDAREPGKWAEQTLAANPDAVKAHRRATHPEEAWQLRMPSGIAIDHESNRIVVCDTVRSRLQVYLKETAYSDPEFNL